MSIYIVYDNTTANSNFGLANLLVGAQVLTVFPLLREGGGVARRSGNRNTTKTSGPNLSAALKEVRGNQSLLGQVVAAFLDECPKLIEDAEAALSDGDMAAVWRSAHPIKCSMRLFNAQPGHLLADRLLRTKHCQDAQAQWLMTALREEFERVRGELLRLLGQYARRRAILAKITSKGFNRY